MSTIVFVFGSNLAGVHGAGAARYALQHEGAIRGLGKGHHGNSYALPTKDHEIRSLSLRQIRAYVLEFLGYAMTHPELVFKVTRIGCGLAGFKDLDIAPLFRDAPSNCYFDTAWKAWLELGTQGTKQYNYWGTM